MALFSECMLKCLENCLKPPTLSERRYFTTCHKLGGKQLLLLVGCQCARSFVESFNPKGLKLPHLVRAPR